MEIDRHSNDRKPAETETRALRDVADRIVEALLLLSPISRPHILSLPDGIMRQAFLFHEVIDGGGYDLLASNVGVTISVFEGGLNISFL
jgi:hypothetical protein